MFLGWDDFFIKRVEIIFFLFDWWWFVGYWVIVVIN